MLARICTLNNSLPQGGRASPSIANLVACSLDEAILKSFPDVRYSRYVDDLTFSGDKCPSKEQVQGILTSHNFNLKEGSFKHTTSGNGQYVTGLNVDSSQPKAPRKERRSIERALHVGNRYSLEHHYISLYKRNPNVAELHSYAISLLGKICSYGQVDLELYEHWRSQFNSMTMKTTPQPDLPA
jgi:RNA-directed DNA polymerase